MVVQGGGGPTEAAAVAIAPLAAACRAADVAAGSSTACSVGWFTSLLIREEVRLADLCERKILFRLKI